MKRLLKSNKTQRKVPFRKKSLPSWEELFLSIIPALLHSSNSHNNSHVTYLSLFVDDADDSPLEFGVFGDEFPAIRREFSISNYHFKNFPIIKHHNRDFLCVSHRSRALTQFNFDFLWCGFVPDHVKRLILS